MGERQNIGIGIDRNVMICTWTPGYPLSSRLRFLVPLETNTLFTLLNYCYDSCIRIQMHKCCPYPMLFMVWGRCVTLVCNRCNLKEKHSI